MERRSLFSFLLGLPFLRPVLHVEAHDADGISPAVASTKAALILKNIEMFNACYPRDHRNGVQVSNHRLHFSGLMVVNGDELVGTWQAWPQPLGPVREDFIGRYFVATVPVGTKDGEYEPGASWNFGEPLRASLLETNRGIVTLHLAVRMAQIRLLGYLRWAGLHVDEETPTCTTRNTREVS